MPAKKVFIINSDEATDKMFLSMKWEIVSNPTQADIFQFTGSGNSDVDPALYNELQHKATFTDPGRDKQEAIYYKIAKQRGIPMAGICRGAQFLCVMNGGWCWQHVNNHDNKEHYVTDWDTGEIYLANSVHHQMMRLPRNRATILATAGEATWKEWVNSRGNECTFTCNPKHVADPEVVLFKDTKCLCVQYHPEYSGWSALVSRYFNLIEQHLFSKEESCAA